MSIRLATAADLPEMQEIYRPFVERTAVSFEYQVPTPEEFFLRFTQHIAQFPFSAGRTHGSAPTANVKHGRKWSDAVCPLNAIFWEKIGKI